MEFRQLGHSGLKVPVLSFGTGTFGGGNEFFKAWGASDVAEATRLVDVCLEAGVNLFDTADIYSNGLSEEILGKAIAGRRGDLLISTKATFRVGTGPNDVGSSRYHLLRASAKTACGGSARITSTFIIYMASTRLRRSKKRCARLITWCRAARYATSRAPTFRDGI
jgi:hypothetical protein